MKRFLWILGVTALMMAPAIQCQTVTLVDGTTISNTARAGINLDSSGTKNYVGVYNASFEPVQYKQVFQIGVSPCTYCSTTQFQPNTANWGFAGYDLNQWAGADVVVAQGCYGTSTAFGDSHCTTSGGTTDPAFGCQATIVSSSANTGGAGPEFVVAALQATTTATYTSGTATITVASGTGTVNGQYVRGIGIAPGTTISSGGGTTSLVLSAAPTLSESGTSLQTFSGGCPGFLGLAGQVMVASTNLTMTNVFPTPVAYWNQGGNNGSPWGVSASGGATITSEVTDVAAGNGIQALMFTTPSGGSVTVSGSAPALNSPAEKTTILNGTYTVSYWAKAISGTPKLITEWAPRSGSTCTNTNTSIASTWTQYSFTCTFAESPTAGGAFPTFFSMTASPNTATTAVVEYDNVSMTNNADTNPTAFTNAYVNGLKAWCQTTQNTTGNPCTLRYGFHPDSETMSNWVLGSGAAQPVFEDFHEGLSIAFPNRYTSLYDFFTLNSNIGAIPVLIFPSTMTTTDMQNLADYLQGNSGSTYGAIRIAQGQTAAWICASGCPFTTIYLEFGNENWNGTFLGHIWGFNTSAPGFSGYYDYATRGQVLYTAFRNYQTSQSYSQTPTKLVWNYQTADQGGNLVYPYALGTVHPDVIEFNSYTAYNVFDTSTSSCLTSGATNANCLLYGPTLTEPWTRTNQANDNSGEYNTITAINNSARCGASGTAQCIGMIYEGDNNGTFNPNTGYNYGQYVSGGTVTGTSGQTCDLTSFNGTGATGVTATVTLTATNSLAPTNPYNQFNWTNAGTPTGTSTTATLSNGTATCSGTATIYAPKPFNQSVNNIFVPAAFQGIVTASQLGQEDQAGLVDHNTFTYNQYYFVEGGIDVNIWGVITDNAGDMSSTNSSLFGGSYNPRPQMLAAMVYNYCKIGPMVQTTWTSNPTYNLPTNNNSVNAATGVPYLESYAFKNGSQRCMVLINRDVYSAHSVSFSGTNAPSGSSNTIYQFTTNPTGSGATGSAVPSALNEAGGISASSTNVSAVYNTGPTSGQSVPTSLPPLSVTAIAWTTGSGTPATVTIKGNVKLSGGVKF